ncbi:MAG: hypothetical protein H0V29_11955 [Thermoleophilaceae bacterium]|nr:hypothetical protein [Thermoleophilaceae bacterium]
MTSSSRAADFAAEQVEAIVEAAQAAADTIRAEAQAEVDEALRAAREQAAAEVAQARDQAAAEVAQARGQADAQRAAAHESAEAELADARRKAIALGEDAKKEAAELVKAAQEAADDSLSEARAISAGLRQLGEALNDQAARILHDVQASHQRMQAQMKAPLGRGSDAIPPSRPGGRRRSTPPADPSPRGGSPFEDLDVPGWVER